MLRRQTLVVFDGQSLNNVPSSASFPALVMAERNEPWCNAAISGYSWTALSASAPGRLHLLPASYERSILILTGGYSDIVIEGNSGATAYADQQSYAAAARSAGFDRVVATTMTHGVATTAPQITQINEYNALVLADSDSDWDAVVDLASIPELSNSSNPVYFSDGLHWTAAGAAVAAEPIRSALASEVSSLDV